MYKSKIVKKNGIEYPIMKIHKNDDEQKMIQLIKMMYFGSGMKPFYTVIRYLLNDQHFKLNGFDKILYGHFYASDIAIKLNELNLLRRSKVWTKNSVRTVIKSIKDRSIEKKERIIYHEQDGLSYQNFSSDDDIIFKSFKEYPELKNIYLNDFDLDDSEDIQSDDEKYKDDYDYENMEEDYNNEILNQSKALYIQSLKNDYYENEL